MIEGAELNIYMCDGDFVEMDLSAVQLEAVLKMLGINVQRENDTTKIGMFDDKSLQKMMDKTINRLIPVEEITRRRCNNENITPDN